MDVLITGESGSGKELVARALHRAGRRKGGRFVAIDCGSLSEGLIESELFGYRKGAFTGAFENRQGLLETANGGVLFLDEVSSMSLRLQGKLLRVLQERELRRVGEQAYQKLDVQVIAATNVDLGSEVLRRRFRKDLYYRVRAVEIRVPSLRQRMEDVPVLIEHFLKRTADAEGGRTKRLSAAAVAVLGRYGYPGNIRELKNMVQAAYYLAPDDVIDVGELPPEVRQCGGGWELEAGEESRARHAYELVVAEKGTFGELVRKAFLKRRISVAVGRFVIHLALTETKGRYREALRLLRIPDQEYAAAMVFLKRHNLYLDFRPYRRSKD
jgi:DNA-binding NtrC family response regulator